jgi:hypothetical protein
MGSIIKLLTNFLYFLGLKKEVRLPSAPADLSRSGYEPRLTKIEKHAVFGYKEGYLVVIVDHQFENVPSWIEWDANRETVNITHMNEDMLEAPASIQRDHIDTITGAIKVLLVSNNKNEKIMHFLPFVGRR